MMKLSNYQIGASGLNAAQNAMQIAQQNITNVNTPGYVRQRVVLQSNNPVGGTSISSLIGNGVLTTGVQRITNDAMTKQFNAQLAEVSYFGYQADVLGQAETLLGTDSISTGLNNFFDAWSQIFRNPMDKNGFNNLISQAGDLTTQINQVASGLDGLQAQVRSDLNIQVSEVNKLLSQIADVNKQIMTSGGNTPNGLLDQRDALISELAQYVPVEVSYDGTNANVATVRINGLIGVHGDTFNEVGLQTDNNGSVTGFTLNDGNLQIRTGVLQSTLDTDQYIETYQKQLSDFADNFAKAYNDILDSALSDILGGESFFTVGANGRIELNPLISKNLDKVQEKLIAIDQDELLSDIFSDIIAIQNEISNGLTLLEQLDTITITVATDVNRANTSLAVHHNLYEGLQQSKLGLEGVNVDEELINVTMLQNYFAANSKTISVMNEMFETIINLL